jgi:hypothetical protein
MHPSAMAGDGDGDGDSDGRRVDAPLQLASNAFRGSSGVHKYTSACLQHLIYFEDTLREYKEKAIERRWE